MTVGHMPLCAQLCLFIISQQVHALNAMQSADTKWQARAAQYTQALLENTSVQHGKNSNSTACRQPHHRKGHMLFHPSCGL